MPKLRVERRPLRYHSEFYAAPAREQSRGSEYLSLNSPQFHFYRLKRTIGAFRQPLAGLRLLRVTREGLTHRIDSMPPS
jgi:hypothetical protein